MLVAWPRSRGEAAAEPGWGPRSQQQNQSSRNSHCMQLQGKGLDGSPSTVTGPGQTAQGVCPGHTGPWVEGRVGSESRSPARALWDPHTCREGCTRGPGNRCDWEQVTPWAAMV